VDEPSVSNITELITNATEQLDNAHAPETGRTLFISSACYKLLKRNPEFLTNDKLGEEALKMGYVGMIDGMKVIKVPASVMPAGVKFIAAHESSLIAAVKLHDFKIHQDPPGINGNQIDGRIIHDAFVLGSRASGVYTAASVTSVLPAPTIQKNTANQYYQITSSVSGTASYYTIDGTDPRYSASAKEYAGVTIPYSSLTLGAPIKAYSVKAGMYDSPVSSVIFNG
jgi:hypothetical protein